MRGVARLPAVLALGCSTLAPKPEPETCTTNAECPTGTVCFSNFCQDSEVVPPQVYVGFNLEEGAQGGAGYRVEVAGCDFEVQLDRSLGVTALEVPRDRMTYDLSLRVFKTDDFDPLAPTTDDMLLADFELRQASRFGRGDLVQTASAPALQGDDVLPTLIRWPRYYPLQPVPALPDALGSRGHILWKIEPKESVAEHFGAAARVYVNLTPLVADGFPECEPEAIAMGSCKLLRTCVGNDLECCTPEMTTCEPEDVADACIPAGFGEDGLTSGVCRAVGSQPLRYDFLYRAECDRAVRANVVRATPDLLPAGPVERAEVTLRYRNDTPSRIGIPVFADWWPEDVPECQRDDQCVEGTQFCNRSTNKCEVALAGLQAAGGSIGEGPEPGRLDTRVFTYCAPDTNVPIDRAYTVRIDPPVDSGLFPMTYEVDVSFPPASIGVDPSPVDLAGLGKSFCLPELGQLSVVHVVPRGEPASLLRTADGEYECCDLDCLPTDEADVPPAAPSSCTLSPSAMTATAPIAINVSAWSEETSQCVPPVVDGNGNLGVLSRTATCSLDEGCLLGSLPLEVADEYTVRIESPTGSVLRSMDTTVAIPPGTTDLEVELPQRPIVHGRVVLSSELCDPTDEVDGDCGSEGAVVLAERLRVGDETTANTPGPYVHQIETFHDPDRGDGAYVLPLDPGVWIMTALPDPGTAGGPASYAMVKLGPEGEFEQPFTLEKGILVTLDLATFDRRSLVIPLDIGSWALQPNLDPHPDRLDEIDPADRLVDLMAPGECLATDPTRGCSIRRLVAGTGLSPSQVGQVRFTARDVGGGAVVCQP